MAHEVAKIKTVATQGEIISSLVRAWKDIFNTQPTKGQIAKLWAQVALESANGSVMFNYNVGNIDWSPDYKGNFYVGGDTTSVGGDPAKRKAYYTKRRSYKTLDDGIKDYLIFLKNRPAVLATLMKGSPKDFSYALASVGYYDRATRDDYMKDGKKMSGYTSGIVARYNDFFKKHKSSPAPQVQPQENTFSSSISSFVAKLESLLDNFTKSASYKKPMNNNFLISIDSNEDLSTKLEYSAVLCSVLKEELGASSNIFVNGDDIQLECSVNFDKYKSLEALKELCFAVSDTFKYATRKIGDINIFSVVIPDKKSNYNELDIKLAEINHRKFKMKFLKK